MTRLFMTADAVGGVWTYALDLAAGLVPLGYETTLAVLGPGPSADAAEAALRIPGLTLIDTGLPLDWTARDQQEIDAAAAGLRRLAQAAGADVVHLNSPAFAAGGGFDAPVVGVCHSCVATWWSAVKDAPLPADFAWRTRALWRGLIACDALIAPSAAFADATARTHDLPRPFVVPNGRVADSAPPAAREPMVFTSGRLWDEGKNIATLDAAAAAIRAPVRAAGPLSGPNGAAAVVRHAEALGGLDAPAVRGWLRRAPIFASAALYEPFGLGVLEAAQAGCALVLSDIPTFRELWSDVAVFAPPRDPAAFADACNALLADPHAAQALGARARQRAQAYSVERMVAGAAEVYAYAAVATARPNREAAA
jgi:glycosyltransferase involved in cell wall biosynthesis